MSDVVKLRNILQNNWPLLFKNIKIIKVKETLSNSSSLKESKETNWKQQKAEKEQKTKIGTKNKRNK